MFGDRAYDVVQESAERSPAIQQVGEFGYGMYNRESIESCHYVFTPRSSCTTDSDRTIL